MEKTKKNFEQGEIRDIVIFILAASFILNFPLIRFDFFLSLIVVSISVFLKVFFHKLMAKRLGCMATFKLWVTGTVISMFSLLLKIAFEFIFLAIGFIEIVPYKFGRLGIKLIKMTPRDYAHISLAGIGTNLFLMLFFGILYSTNPDLVIFQTISKINGLMSFFSLLPIPPLEGSHVFTWSFWIWGFLMIFNITGLVTVIL